MIIFVVIGAQIFSYALFSYGLTRALAEWTASLPEPPAVTLGVIIVMHLVVGMFIDSISMMVLTLGVVYPVTVNLGYDPIWFAVALVILIEIGLIAPPVGINLFTINAIVPGLTSVAEIARGSLPFVILMLLGVVLLIIFPRSRSGCRARCSSPLSRAKAPFEFELAPRSGCAHSVWPAQRRCGVPQCVRISSARLKSRDYSARPSRGAGSELPAR